MGIMDRIKEEAASTMAAVSNTASQFGQQQAQPQQQQQEQMTQQQYQQYQLQQQQLQAQRQAQFQQQQQVHHQQQQQVRIPQYVVLQVTLKEKMIGTGSGNLSELEKVINRQAAQGYRLHTISTASGGSAGLMGADRIQATMVFEKL